MIIFDPRNRVYITSKLRDTGYTSSFGTRLSRNPQNHRIVMKQVHGDKIVKITAQNIDREKFQNTDGMITRLNGVTLIVKTADCVPIIFADTLSSILGVSHQGWRGTLLNLPLKMVNFLAKEGVQKENIIVAIGPSISACCYKIYGDRLDLFRKTFPRYVDRIFIKNNNDIFLNLGYLAYLQLVDAGIQKNNIDYFPFCTSCHKDHFYSYNRDKSTKRMESWIAKY